MASNDNNSYLSFELNKEVFCAHTKSVLHILELQKITKVPQAPEYMLGVFNLRGNVLPVIDARIKFGLKQSEYTSDTCIIVTEIKTSDDETLYLGMLVDAVMEVFELGKKDIQAPPTVGNQYNGNYIKGLIKRDEKFIMLLDINQVLSTDEISNIMMTEKIVEE